MGCNGCYEEQKSGKNKGVGLLEYCHGLPLSVTPLPYFSYEKRRPVVLRHALSGIVLPLSGNFPGEKSLLKTEHHLPNHCNFSATTLGDKFPGAEEYFLVILRGVNFY